MLTLVRPSQCAGSGWGRDDVIVSCARNATAREPRYSLCLLIVMNAFDEFQRCGHTEEDSNKTRRFMVETWPTI